MSVSGVAFEVSYQGSAVYGGVRGWKIESIEIRVLRSGQIFSAHVVDNLAAKAVQPLTFVAHKDACEETQSKRRMSGLIELNPDFLKTATLFAKIRPMSAQGHQGNLSAPYSYVQIFAHEKCRIEKGLYYHMHIKHIGDGDLEVQCVLNKAGNSF